MSDSLIKIRNQLNDYVQGLEKKQKIMIAAAIVFIILSLIAIIYFFNKPEYIEIYSDLEAKQAGEIMEALQANNVKARFGENRGAISIEVPKEEERNAQIVVATEDLPSARFSFEDAFSGNSFMMTSEERAKRYTYALQNNLSDTIEEIKGVKSATVSLVTPEKSAFVLNANESQAKASVRLEMDGNSDLDINSINGIAILVSNAVEGLLPDNVTIHGNDGKVLNIEPDENEEIYDPNDNIALQQSIKNELERSISNFLSNVYGYGNIVVMANVKLDFDSEVTEIKEFSPPVADEITGIPRSLQELTQTVKEGAAGGVPTDPNLENPPAYVEGNDNNSTYSEASKTINYEINELHKQIVKEQGQVKDVTVAVYINSGALNDGDLTVEEKDELKDIIAAAAGLDTKVVEVGVQQFNGMAGNIEQDVTTKKGAPNMLLWLVAIVLAAAAMGLGYLVIRKRREEEIEEIEEVEEIIEELDEMIIPDPLEEIDFEKKGSEAKQQIEKLVTNKPDAVAQLLKNWINED